MPRTCPIAISLMLAGAAFATATSVEAAVVTKQWSPRPDLAIGRHIAPVRIVAPVRPLPVVVRPGVPTRYVPPLVPTPGLVPSRGTSGYVPTGPNGGGVTPPVPQTGPSCASLQQNMSDLQTKMTTLQGFIANFDRVIASYTQQLNDLNAQIASAMQSLQQFGGDIQALRQAQDSMNTAADEADAAGQGGIAATLRAGAQALGDVISRLHNDETALFAKMNGLLQQAQTLRQLLQQFIAGRKQAQTVLDQLNQQYALAFGGYEGQCGG